MDEQMNGIAPRPKMPPEIAAAIVKVKKQVKQLGKDERNQFAKFNYVSVDKFYDVIGRMMAEAGIFVITDEVGIAAEKRETVTESGQVKSAVWITATYELALFHETGVEYGPIHRTIMVQATGPQAFGSGMSYVEKYFLRSLFKVPTGEEDADAAPQEGVPEGGPPARRAPPRQAAPASKPAPVAPPTDLIPHELSATGNWVDWGGRFVAAIKVARTMEELDAWILANNDHLSSCQTLAPKVYDRIMANIDDMRAVGLRRTPTKELVP